MKTLILLLTTSVLFTACSTVDQAKRDFRNFQKTIYYNSKSRVVYANSQW